MVRFQVFALPFPNRAGQRGEGLAPAFYIVEQQGAAGVLLLEIGFDIRVVGLMHHGDIVIAHGIGGEPRVVQDNFIFPFGWPDDDVGNDVGVCTVKEALQRGRVEGADAPDSRQDLLFRKAQGPADGGDMVFPDIF